MTKKADMEFLKNEITTDVAKKLVQEALTNYKWKVDDLITSELTKLVRVILKSPKYRRILKIQAGKELQRVIKRITIRVYTQ